MEMLSQMQCRGEDLPNSVDGGGLLVLVLVLVLSGRFCLEVRPRCAAAVDDFCERCVVWYRSRDADGDWIEG